MPGGNWVTVGFDSPWSVLRRALGETGMEGKMMEKSSKTMEELDDGWPERRGAESSVVSMETLYYKTIY